MNCPTCKMALDFPQSVLEQLTVCPFCSSELPKNNTDPSIAPKPNKNDQTSNIILDKIIKEHGKDICSSDRSDELKNILKNIDKTDKASYEVLILFQQYGLLSDLYDSISDSANERKETLKSIIDFLYRKFDIPTNSGKQMTLSIAYSLGINVKSLNKTSLENSSLSELIQNYIAEQGIYCFGSIQSIEDILDSCEDIIDKNELLILFRSGIANKMRNALGDPASTRSEVFSRSIELLKKLHIPETKSIAMLRKFAKGIGFSTENKYFVDKRDGQAYRIVDIGNQTWMAENFRYRIHNSFFYNNDEKTVSLRGVLYTWEAAKKACPPGWRLPTIEDFRELQSYVYHEKSDYGGDFNIDDLNESFRKQRDILNYCLKSKEEDEDSMDFFGFSAIRGGRLKLEDDSHGTFEEDDQEPEYWTSTINEKPVFGGKPNIMVYEIAMPSFGSMNKTALPVRYIKEK